MKKIITFSITIGILLMSAITSFAATDVSLKKDGAEYTPIRYSFTNYDSKMDVENKYHASIGYTPKGATSYNNGKETINDYDQIAITVYDDTDLGRAVRLQWYENGEIKVLGYEFTIDRSNEKPLSYDIGMPVDIGYFLKNFDNKVFVAVPDPLSGGGRVFVTDKIVQEIERFLYPQQDDNTYNDAYSEARLQFLAEMRSSIYSNLNK